ncbi:MAG: hypothetical protein IKT37_03810 [Clostridia bacterium]|nr:hypothetical protein [Clostridia bacterium]
MECIACKKDIADGSVFCNFCGSKQTVTSYKMTLDEMLEKIQDLISITGYSFSETGILNCKKWIREFGFDILYESIEDALSQYLVKDDDGKYTEESVDEVFSKIGGIARNKHNAITKPYISDVRRITNYAKKAFYINYYELNDLSADLNNILYYFFTTNQYDGKVDDILALVRGSKDKYEFFEKIEALKTDCGIEG